MKKVLFLINTLEGGGAEKVLTDIVNNINQQKYNITVMTIIDKGIYINQLNHSVNYKSMISFKNKLLLKICSYLIQIVLSPKLIYTMFIKDKYDIEIAFIEGAPVKILSESTNKKAKKYTWIHTDLEKYYGQEKLFRSIKENSNCYKKFNKIFCVSQDVKEAFSRKFEIDKNIYVQYNVLNDLDIKKKSEVECEYQFSDQFKIISVGRLVYQKGYDRLIDVCRMLSDQGHEFELLIIGEGNEKEKLVKSVIEFNLQDKVKFLGFQDNPYKYMKHCDLFVCSSRVEGFSTVATEATILGIPIVTTSCAGMKDLLGDNQYGMIVENNTNALLTGLKAILEDKSLLDHYQKKAIIRGKYFTRNERIKELESILDEN